MTNPTSVTISFDNRRALRILAAATILSVVLGAVWLDSPEALFAYLSITLAGLAPSVLWFRLGTPGIPVFPAVALMHIVYYAIPILRGNVGQISYAPLEILQCGMTVAAFLVMGTISWLVVVRKTHRLRTSRPQFVSGAPLKRIIFLGIGLGILYFVSLYSGLLDWLGSFFGLFRSAVFTATSIACFMLGHARGRGVLRGTNWALAIAGLGMLIIMAWSTLFLVGGAMFFLTAVFGFAITAKRIPWRTLAAAAAIITVFHAGKGEMRQKYWAMNSNSNIEMSVTQVPGLMTEWAYTGLGGLVSSGDNVLAIDRASLLQLLLRVQRLAPDHVPFLYGETYALLPSLLIPRFLEPDKLASQAGMTMLNIRFGFQTVQAASVTSIGWGLIAEAYANFGYIGVIGIAVFMGSLGGLLTRWSDGAPIISAATLTSIVATMLMINLEQDFSASFHEFLSGGDIGDYFLGIGKVTKEAAEKAAFLLRDWTIKVFPRWLIATRDHSATLLIACFETRQPRPVWDQPVSDSFLSATVGATLLFSMKRCTSG